MYYKKYTLFHLSLEGQKCVILWSLVFLGSKSLLWADWSWSSACCSVQWNALGKGAAGSWWVGNHHNAQNSGDYNLLPTGSILGEWYSKVDFEWEWFAYIFVSSVVGSKNIIITLKTQWWSLSIFSYPALWQPPICFSLCMCLLILDILCK